MMPTTAVMMTILATRTSVCLLYNENGSLNLYRSLYTVRLRKAVKRYSSHGMDIYFRGESQRMLSTVHYTVGVDDDSRDTAENVIVTVTLGWHSLIIHSTTHVIKIFIHFKNKRRITESARARS